MTLNEMSSDPHNGVNSLGKETITISRVGKLLICRQPFSGNVGGAN